MSKRPKDINVEATEGCNLVIVILVFVVSRQYDVKVSIGFGVTVYFILVLIKSALHT